MKYKVVLIVILSLVASIQAKKNQQIKNASQFFEEIGRSTSDISAFAKSVMKLDSSEQESEISLKLDLPCKHIGSNNDDENIGKYLNGTTDEELRARIEKNHIAEGKNLLNDFFKTVVYKTMQNKLKKFVEAMTSCSFLTPEESKKIRSLKIFYPNDYEYNQYSWKSIFKDDKLNAFGGELARTIGLKGSADSSQDDFFVMIISFDYKCTLGELVSHPLTLRLIAPQGIAPIEPKRTFVELFNEPRYDMWVSVMFLRQKFKGMYSYVLYTCGVECEQRVQFPEKSCKLVNNESEKKPAESIASAGNGCFLTNDDVCVDADCSQPPCIICESFKINRGLVNPYYNDLTTMNLDFVIKTHPKKLMN